jgi:hypothetical protein
LREWDSDFPWTGFPSAVDWSIHGVKRGQGGADALEVVWGIGGNHSATALRNVWSERKQRRPNPVVAVHLESEDGPALLVGPSREGITPPIVSITEIGRLTRLLEVALQKPNRFRAREHIEEYLQKVNDPAWGVKNKGLFATHSLFNTPNHTSDWDELSAQGVPLLPLRREELTEELGFSVEMGSDGRHHILRVDDNPTALGLFLPADEGPRTHVARFGESPVLYGFRIADEQDLPWIIVNAGDRLQLYSTRPDIGVGKRGRTETYTEIMLDMIADQDAGYVPLLFSSDALKEEGYLEDLIRRSAERVTSLSERLRDRIYDDVLPRLATGIAEARSLDNPSAEDLRTTHGMALSMLFRMLFISYAEDRDLLPYSENDAYATIAMKRLASQWAEEEPEFENNSIELWSQVQNIARAIHDGSEEYGVPAYGGTPFSEDADVSAKGALLATVELSDDVFGPVLFSLILDDSDDEEGIGPIDFRELSVREFGTIYEGLLGSELGRAAENLTTDREGYYRPANDEDEITIEEGGYYLHNSGQRKSSASYYTKDFAVEHLLDRSLESALDEHFARIDEMETDAEKSEVFFDFMVADISMGSGHFLVSAVDRIEKRMSTYLDANPLEGVRNELNRLWNLAAEALGKSIEDTGINQPMLLRRQIARRCIYGVDINPTAVELSQVSIWIHTFVPGLPLSFLDWHLRQGNSVVGIATQSEAWDVINPSQGQITLTGFTHDLEGRMNEIMEMMLAIARQSDASIQEVEEAREAYRTAFVQLAPWEALMDVLAASRIDQEIENQLQSVIDTWSGEPELILDSQIHTDSRAVLEGLDTFHHQVMFPEVMWRENPGFDVIVGNPPWEKAKVERDDFWTRHIPGFQGLSVHDRRCLLDELDRPDLEEALNLEVQIAERVRTTLTSGLFPGMGKGDPDLYKAFCHRFIQLLREEGRMGVVLPRAAFTNQGSTEFRERVLQQGAVDSMITLFNAGGWVFDDVEHRYTISLFSVRKTNSAGDVIPVGGPYSSYAGFISGINEGLIEIDVSLILSATDNCLIPMLSNISSEEAHQALIQMRNSPRFDLNNPGEFRFRPSMDIHGNQDRSILTLDTSSNESNLIPVYGGQGFDIWNCHTGNLFALVDCDLALERINRKRRRANSRSAFSEMSVEWRMDDETNPILRPRIAFREVTNRGNTRTTIVCLVPDQVVLTHKAPYMLRIRGDESDEAYLIGILSSRIFDWYTRRFVETSLSYFILNPAPIPRPSSEDELRIRLVELSGRLAAHDERLSEWAEEVGVDCGPIGDGAQREMIMELEAVVALLYGLSANQLRVIYRTFHHDGTVDGEPWEEQFNAVMVYYAQHGGVVE